MYRISHIFHPGITAGYIQKPLQHKHTSKRHQANTSYLIKKDNKAAIASTLQKKPAQRLKKKPAVIPKT